MRIDKALKEKLKKNVVKELAHEMENSVLLKTPFPVSQVELDSIYAAFPQLKDCQMTNEVDKALLGGFVLKYKSKVVDASLRTKIATIVQSLS